MPPKPATSAHVTASEPAAPIVLPPLDTPLWTDLVGAGDDAAEAQAAEAVEARALAFAQRLYFGSWGHRGS